MIGTRFTPQLQTKVKELLVKLSSSLTDLLNRLLTIAEGRLDYPSAEVKTFLAAYKELYFVEKESVKFPQWTRVLTQSVDHLMRRELTSLNHQIDSICLTRSVD